jgi:hypothetical protein
MVIKNTILSKSDDRLLEEVVLAYGQVLEDDRVRKSIQLLSRCLLHLAENPDCVGLSGMDPSISGGEGGIRTPDTGFASVTA